MPSEPERNLLQTRSLGDDMDAVAPDGSQVRLLVSTTRGSMAHFLLPAGLTSRAVRHRTVEEVWFFLSGQGQMWRRRGDVETVVAVSVGLSISIPVATAFQFRSLGSEPLAAVATTMPVWPGDGEAEQVDGPWAPSQ